MRNPLFAKVTQVTLWECMDYPSYHIVHVDPLSRIGIVCRWKWLAALIKIPYQLRDAFYRVVHNVLRKWHEEGFLIVTEGDVICLDNLVKWNEQTPRLRERARRKDEFWRFVKENY